MQFSAEQKSEVNFSADENFAKPEILRLEEEWNRYSPENLKQSAIRLRTLGAIKHKLRDYKTAIRFYEQSLKIQDRLGEREDKEYALTLYLKSIAQFRIGQNCQAVISVRTVIEIYRLLGDIDSAIQAEDSLKKYSSFCVEK
ncbi:tetratricopeptide repeat protein [Leptospira sp. 201903071]|nr:tetratricopeptide repeat protein [Leptospira ainazelensis]